MSKTTFIKSVFILCLMALPLGVSAQSLKGDVNDDGLLGITDVNLLIDYLLTNDSTGINLANAASEWSGESPDYLGTEGVCWSRTLYSDSPEDAYYLFFTSERVGWHEFSRKHGTTVRAVRVSQN